MILAWSHPSFTKAATYKVCGRQFQSMPYRKNMQHGMLNQEPTGDAGAGERAQEERNIMKLGIGPIAALIGAFSAVIVIAAIAGLWSVAR